MAVEEEYLIKPLEDWIMIEKDELLCCIGEIIHDPNNVWGVGYQTTAWAASAFDVLDKEYVLKIDTDNAMFEVFVLNTKEQFYGGWFENEVEWDGDKEPTLSIKEQIKSEIIGTITK